MSRSLAFTVVTFTLAARLSAQEPDGDPGKKRRLVHPNAASLPVIEPGAELQGRPAARPGPGIKDLA
jgi:hypothetical protein